MSNTNTASTFTFGLPVWEVPTSKKSFFLVEVSSPLWGYGDCFDVCIGVETDTMPVFVAAGKTIAESIGISKTFGDQIMGAKEISRAQYIQEVRARFPVYPADVSGGEF